MRKTLKTPMQQALIIEHRQNKLDDLCDQFDIDLDDIDDHLLHELLYNVVPAICMNKDCDYTGEYEPDQTEGFCENCDTNSCESLLSLMGVI